MDLRKMSKLMLFFCPLVLFILWLLFIFSVKSKFYAISNIDPLAMINILFPHFWIILSGFALLCFATLYFESTKKWLHVALLLQFSLILYYTPFLLSGFSWSPDSLWHGGVAGYIPEILSGSGLPLSDYAQSYPLSFIVTYSVEQILGVDVFIFTLFIYPVVCIVAISLLAYVFASRFLNPKMAFTAMLIALPALHFIEPHVSPFSLGTILVLTSFILLTIKGRVTSMLSFITIFVLNLTHPISPLSLGIFLMVIILIDKFHRQSYLCKPITSLSTSVLLFLVLLWLSWTFLQAITLYTGVRSAVLNVLNLNFFKRLIYAAEWTVGGQSFIYGNISRLRLVIYAIFLSFVSFLTLLDLKRIILAWKGHSVTNYKSYYESYKRAILSLTSIFCGVFGYTLFLASQAHCLLGRGLFFFILMASLSIGSYLVQKRKIFKNFIIFGLFLFLLFSFPIVSYSKEAYNSFTPSENVGLNFLSHNVCLCKYSVSMGADQQLASYVNLSEGLMLAKFPPNTSTNVPNFIALRLSSYYAISMKYDLSFEDNSFTRLRNNLERNISYNKIYSNPKFEIYCNT